MPGQGDTLTCSCSADATNVGTIWGTTTYTDDSAICRAALHAGAVGAGGGVIEVMRAPGLASYAASSQNGVNSLSYGNWTGSIVFAAAAALKTK